MKLVTTFFLSMLFMFVESQSLPYMVNDTFCSDGVTPDTIDVFANDNGSFTPWVIYESPLFGNASFYGNSAVYIPGVNFMGFDHFSFVACDEETSVCDSSTVFVQCPPMGIHKPTKEHGEPIRATNLQGQNIPIDSKGIKILWFDGGYIKVFQ